jgi:hypothetical protein
MAVSCKLLAVNWNPAFELASRKVKPEKQKAPD